VLAPE
jgi:hypothetical protein